MMNDGFEEIAPSAVFGRISEGARELSAESLSFLAVMNELGAGGISAGFVYLKALLSASLERNEPASADVGGLCKKAASLCGSEPERVRRGAEYALEELRASGALGEGSFGEMLDELSAKMRFYYEKSNGGGMTTCTNFFLRFVHSYEFFISTIFDNPLRIFMVN